MNLLLLISGFTLLALAWTIVATSRSRNRRRLRVRFRSGSAPEQITPAPLEALETPREDLPEQLMLFANVEQQGSLADPHQVLVDQQVESVTLAPDPARRRSVTGERLDWQYFNKDAGDLADPEGHPRMRPASAPPPRSESRSGRRA